MLSYVDLNSLWYSIRMFLELFFFYIIFYHLYNGISLKRKMIYLFTILPISFFIQSNLEGFGEIFTIIACYLSLKKTQEYKYVLLNKLLISAITPYVISISVSIIFVNNPLLTDLLDFYYVILEVTTELVLVICLLYCLKLFKFVETINQYSSLFSIVLLSFYYLSLQTILYAADYFEAYEAFIFGITLFLMVQIIFLVIIFAREIKKQKEIFKNINLQKQFSDFKTYTIQLEKNQLELQKFKHDYKNLILSLKKITKDSSPEEIEKQINALEDYSEDYLNTINWDYKDMVNLENVYLKSLFISKTYLIQENKINFHFECKNLIENVPIQIFDLVRILGVLLDNAIEESMRMELPQINVAIIKDKMQLEFIIQNRTFETREKTSRFLSIGYTTKKGHLGLGLSNIQEIKKKYSNVYIQYEKAENQFTSHVLLMFEGME